MQHMHLPVAIIGAGPVGLAAAAHLVAGGDTPVIFEAGDRIASAMHAWSHIQVFSPWKYNIDPVAQALLSEHGDWVAPDGEAYPTGGEIIAQYLTPLASLPAIAPHIHLNTRVLSVTRQGHDKMKTAGRDEMPFALQVEHADGSEEVILARAVIDASGTWSSPNPLGTNGVPAPGERRLQDRISYGMPDVRATARARFANKRILVVGSGHSAFNALNDLVALKQEEPQTEIFWAIRRAAPGQMFGGGENDQLEARGELGRSVEQLVANDTIHTVMGFRTSRLGFSDDGVIVSSDEQSLPPVDEIIATTGFRPNLEMLRELRLDIDPVVESPTTLAPMIDPNIHSCGTVRPHGAVELQHPERDFYIAGMKSYGRAPTFLMLTGYEQVRSIVAALRGDWDAARRVELTLPETGVCTLGNASGAGGCCTTATSGTALEIANTVSCCGSPQLVTLGAGAPAASRCCG